MPAIKLLNIFALSTFAILLCSLAPSQSLAASIQPNHLARQLPNHHGIAKKRGTKRCKSRSSSVPLSSTPAPKPTSTPPNVDTVKSTNPPKNSPSPSSTSPASVATKSPTSTPSGSGKLAIAWAMGNDKRIALLSASPRVKMFHLWDAQVPSAVKDTGIPYSIMLWSNAQDRVNSFQQVAKKGYASYVFGFNEYVKLICFSFVSLN